MDFDISACGADELPQLVAALDTEFVTSRGRSVSLSARFPSVFSRANLANLLVARERTGISHRITAAIAIRRFRWIASGKEYAGAMIGAVWVDAGRRRSGLGATMLKHAQRALEGSADFAVLWTAQPAFYAKCGWLAADPHARFGEIAGEPSSAAGSRGGDAVDFSAVRAIWQRQAQYAAREALWQAPLPLPAVSLEMFRAPGAYAIAGRDGDTLFCHEMLGDAAAFAELLAQMRAACQKINFNARAGSPSYDSLATAGVVWQPRPLAMWLPLKRDIAGTAADWYVPWLDRI
jgi:predicted N-acetyltransferase YhbS